tara:strand:- start:3180 stop:4037 length:858 start_codon:yes stop_codon:yes gene_type:complete
MIRTLPFIFVILWSSAFITTKPLVNNSEPFTALAFRFFIVSLGFYFFSIVTKQKILVNKKNIFQSILSGVLFHGFYLGGVFFSISIGMPTAIAALIVTLQPILTNVLSGKFLGEKVSRSQWLGVLFGFVGSAMVIGLDIGSDIPLIGLFSTLISLISITASTIWQKKLSLNLPLSVSNLYQSIGGFLFHLLIIVLFVEPYIDLNKIFIIAMSHQIILVSFGAFTILMFLIKNNSASKTVSIFFLIPPTSAFMAWLFLGEKLNHIDIIGFVIASVGVYIATRNSKN